MPDPRRNPTTAALSAALGDEIYRCDVLGIPNCD